MVRGFTTDRYKEVKFEHDDKAPSGNMYFLNQDWMKFVSGDVSWTGSRNYSNANIVDTP